MDWKGGRPDLGRPPGRVYMVDLIQRLVTDLIDLYGPGELVLKPRVRGTLSSGFDWTCKWVPEKDEGFALLPAGAGKDPRIALVSWQKQAIDFFRHLKQEGIKQQDSRIPSLESTELKGKRFRVRAKSGDGLHPDYGKLTKAELKSISRPGVKMWIVGMNYERWFFHQRLIYRIQCGCNFVFTCAAGKKRVSCPKCHYSAEMHILEKEWGEREVTQVQTFEEVKPEEMGEIKAYCLMCREKVNMVPPIMRRPTEGGRFTYIGKCEKCGHNVSIVARGKQVAG
jgi:hypothetical protein